MPQSKLTLNLGLIAAAFVAALGTSLLQGCGSSAPSTSTSTFTQAYSQVLGQPLCVNCHQPGGNATLSGVSLDFTTQALAYSTLTSSLVAANDRTCPNVHIVVANSPTTSYLATILFSNYFVPSNYVVSGCTPYSAHQSLGLSTSDETVVVGWINGGALNN